MGDELISRLDADPHMCLVESMGLLNARVMRIYRRSNASDTTLMGEPKSRCRAQPCARALNTSGGAGHHCPHPMRRAGPDFQR
jgi:hypothetical protein